MAIDDFRTARNVHRGGRTDSGNALTGKQDRGVGLRRPAGDLDDRDMGDGDDARLWRRTRGNKNKQSNGKHEKER